MTDQTKRQLVDELVKLATDPAAHPWGARLYLAAALWLESERERPLGEDRTILTLAAERVRKLETGETPPSFRGFVRSWLPLPEGP